MPGVPTLSRRLYEDLYYPTARVCRLFARHNRAFPRDPSHEWVRSIHYPVSTGDACRELADRFVRVTPKDIEYLIRRGVIEPPSDKGSKNRLWSADEVDALAVALADEGRLTDVGMMLHLLDVDADQYVEAKLAFKDEFDETPFEEAAMVVIPGDFDAGIPATVRFREMSDGEEEDREAAINESREGV